MREASAAAMPVTISGAGTGVTGARVPFGGWVISLEKLNRLEVHPGYAVAGPRPLASGPPTGHRPLATGHCSYTSRITGMISGRREVSLMM
jgi:hypothetical protein